MAWGELTLIAGLLVGLCGAVLMVRQVNRRMQELQRHYSRHVEAMADLASQALLFGGLVLLQIGTIIEHMSRGASPSIPWLMVLGCMAMVLLFGFQLGRLFMRWQVRKILIPPQARQSFAPSQTGA